MPRDERRGTGYTPLMEARERAMREDSGNAGLVVAYQSPTGAKPLPGDESFPFVMVPNETTEPYLVTDVLPAYVKTLATGLNLTEAIDVRGYRRLTFFVQYVIPYVVGATPPDDPTNALAFIPQVANDKATPWAIPNSSLPYFEGGQSPKQWFSISVVDPVIRGVAPTVTNPMTSLLPVQYGARNVYMTQLNIPYPSTAVPQRVEIETTLVFDVAPYDWFRLSYAKYDDQRGADTNTPVLTPENGPEVFRLWAQKER